MIEIKNVTKIYKDKEREVKAVDDVSLNIKEGEIFGVIGYSGAGKSTLIRMINGLEVPTTGEVIVDGEKIDPTDKKKLQRQRSRIGMIFQGYNLLKTATVLENVMLPLKLEGLEKNLPNSDRKSISESWICGNKKIAIRQNFQAVSVSASQSRVLWHMSRRFYCPMRQRARLILKRRNRF